MKRIILLISLLTLVGCAHNTAPRQSPEEWLNEHSDEQIEAVTSSCAVTHQNFITGTSPVDCQTRGIKSMLMSFPKRSLYIEHELGIAEFLSLWCTSIGNRTGNLPAIQLEIREERKIFGVPCEKLLNSMKENTERGNSL